MKKFSIYFLAVLLSTLVFSCKDEEEVPSNSFTYDGATTALTQGLSTLEEVYIDGDKEYYSFEVVLLSDGFTVNNNGNVNGTGDAISFTLVTGIDRLATGTYDLNTDDENPAVMTVTDGAIYLNFDTETEEGDTHTGLTAGTVTVTKTTENITVEFEVTIDGKELTGRYVGDLPLIVGDDDDEVVVEG